MAEGSETPGGEPGAVQGRGSSTEGDLLAERRARRAAESGETALVRRAETAEATVRTLETHVATLQQRLHAAEEETRQMSELIEAEGVAVSDQSLAEQELRRAKQREYAEQRLRVEAEDRLTELERESRIEIDQLTSRLSASEHRARDLAGQLERAQRKLAEAQQAAATEIAATRRAEHAFQSRLSVLEGRAVEIQLGLAGERAARERSDRLLESMREGHRRVEALVADLGGAVGRLRAAIATEPPQGEPGPASPARGESPPYAPPAPHPGGAEAEPAIGAGSPPPARGRPGEVNREMTEALAAAVERLRARVEDVGEGVGPHERPQEAVGQEPPAPEPEGSTPTESAAERARAIPSEPAGPTAAAPAQPDTAPSPPAAEPAARPQAARVSAPAHKHSMSLLTRLRLRRKDRRRRRSDAAEPPSMTSQ
jgi:hypothetical protein